MDTEREDWDALVSHPGWLRLVAYAKGQWGGLAYRSRIDQAIAKAEADKTDVASAVKAVNAVSDEINRLLSYPKDRVKALAPARRSLHVAGWAVKPLGDRVFIRPEANETTTDSDLILVEHAKPAVQGTVVSVGLAEHPLKTEADDLAEWLEGLDVDEPDGYRANDAAKVLRMATQREPLVKAGDYVLFSWNAGQEIWIDDERLLIMRESDILAVID